MGALTSLLAIGIEETLGVLVVLFLMLVLFLIVASKLARRLTVLEYEQALRYSRGRFSRTLGPGTYWYMPLFTSFRRVDTRLTYVAVAGQELLSSDAITIKISLAANYRIVDSAAAINKVTDYYTALYTELQLALRQVIGAIAIDECLEQRAQLPAKVKEIAAPQLSGLGIELVSVDIKDIMFPGQLKETFAQVVKARKEAAAALERTRGETASLRNLANAAKLLENNPSLMNLRIIQAVSESTGNTFVWPISSQDHTIPIPSPKAKE
jgi:regulator of protease activity HflC (stomatin/prohibitin superfamily)